ncbi:RNI-like protein [Rhizoclosmatium globosum]|uniref:RNI-like protein n=1 Tax=Rhizoclosmatium globosum TaxID=329046 RepID=A0A1Y1ZZM9_9FUNG|nr:RNI-like protein [Rhizoclosmatium globosum]|eukprot:ORY15654.1 RNI-like protein [Rhizoclosmatium globosum]
MSGSNPPPSHLVASSVATNQYTTSEGVVTEKVITETHEVTKVRAIEVEVEEEQQKETETVVEEGELDVVWLADQIRSNEPIAALDLSGAELSCDDVVLIAKALEVNETLEKLDIEENEIDAVGLRAIAHMLTINSTLRELRIGQQDIVVGTAVEIELSDAIFKNETLTTFTLNVRDQASWIRIDKALSRNAELYAIAQKQKKTRTVYVEDTEQVTTTRVEKDVKKIEEADVTTSASTEAEYVVVETPAAAAPVAVAVETLITPRPYSDETTVSSVTVVDAAQSDVVASQGYSSEDVSVTAAAAAATAVAVGAAAYSAVSDEETKVVDTKVVDTETVTVESTANAVTDAYSSKIETSSTAAVAAAAESYSSEASKVTAVESTTVAAAESATIVATLILKRTPMSPLLRPLLLPPKHLALKPT